MQPEQNGPSEFKRDFNIACWLFMIHQRGLIVPLRTRFGKEAFGVPTALAFVLMCGWASFSMDLYMWGWIGLWLMALVAHRMESTKLANSGVRIHSQSDGFCKEAMWLGRTERNAKLFIEPAFMALIGGLLYQVYLAYGLPVIGLPYFFLSGVVSLPFVAMVQERTYEKRMIGMSDARIESEQMVRDMRDRYGE